MAWLQSSFTSHQLLGDSSNNHKKGFKGSSNNKNTDPDKSDTPLLHDSTHSPDNENSPSGWLKSTSSSNNVEKKQNLLTNSSKSSFLPHGFFDKSSGNSKGKLQTNQNASGPSSSHVKKPGENMKLLSEEDKKKHPLFKDEEEEENEEDSDDDWCIPHLGGYQKIRPCAE